MPELVKEIGQVLLEPLAMLDDPTRRVYWPFLHVAAVAAMVTAFPRERGLLRILRSVFDPRIWLHRSSLLDVKLMIVKAVLSASMYGAFLVSAGTVAAVVAALLIMAFGEPRPLSWSASTIAALFTVSAFFAEDGSRYVFHRAMHRVPALWQIHKVHHSAQVLTPFTLYRTHPIESVAYRLRGALALGSVTGVMFYAFGDRVDGYDIMGVDALGFLFNAALANLRHSHVWISFGPLERFVISPAQHQIHHSRDPKHFDRNFGSFLSLWDQLGGTLYITRGRERLRYGLSNADTNHDQRLLSALFAPVAAVFGRAQPAPSSTIAQEQSSRAFWKR